MNKKSGLKIRSISHRCFLKDSQLRRGDTIVSVNGEPIEDELDFRFFTADSSLEITFLRNDTKHTIEVHRPEGHSIDIQFYDKSINRCSNRCIFCFIDQMPPGLRKGLYIKDEDVKHSFVNGNYVTLSSMTLLDLEKVARLGISPLYISVHATDTGIRNCMLGNKKAPSVMAQLQFLRDHGMYFHTQIVLCPGYNDGDVLKKTIRDLFSLGDALRSIAVVPVGITRFRKQSLLMVDIENAIKICTYISELSDRMATKDGIRRLFCADELFLRAGLEIPQLSYYEEYPQIENGVGLLRMLLEEWKLCKRKLRKKDHSQNRENSIVVLSSVSASPYIAKICKDGSKLLSSKTIDVLTVNNSYFGESVTVAGLLTARDVIPLLKKSRNKYACAFLPAVMFNYAGSTLDGYSLERIENVSGIKVIAAESICKVFGV